MIMLQEEVETRDADPFSPRVIVGTSAAFLEAVALAQRVAAIPSAPVLLSGPAGTGKALFARGIHYAGATAGEPFVVVNCAGLPESMLEKEIFGCEFGEGGPQQRGLLELAAAGTLMLAEISELPQRLQAQLLRALEERRYRRLGGSGDVAVQCRLVATSKVALDLAAARGDFREDLLLLLGTCHVRLPSLRERPGDIRLLADHFLRHVAREYGAAPKSLASESEQALLEHAWPGNVRELRIAIERAALLTDEETILPAHLTIQHRFARSAASGGTTVAAEIRIPLSGKTLEQIEHEAIALTLQMTRGNRSAAARQLGISRPTLLRKLALFGLK
jgi:DNA-binding NtrC family response regulator